MQVLPYLFKTFDDVTIISWLRIYLVYKKNYIWMHCHGHWLYDKEMGS